MKRDAFKGVFDGLEMWSQFSYKKQLSEAMHAVKDGELFAFAGIWDGWKNAEGQWVKTCSILTTIANAVTGTIHDRMPVILHPDSYDLWLDRGMHNVAAISELLKPFDARQMRSYPVSTRINHVANDDEECSRRVEVAEGQKQLFV